MKCYFLEGLVVKEDIFDWKIVNPVLHLPPAQFKCHRNEKLIFGISKYQPIYQWNVLHSRYAFHTLKFFSTMMLSAVGESQHILQQTVGEFQPAGQHLVVQKIKAENITFTLSHRLLCFAFSWLQAAAADDSLVHFILFLASAWPTQQPDLTFSSPNHVFLEMETMNWQIKVNLLQLILWFPESEHPQEGVGCLQRSRDVCYRKVQKASNPGR